MVSILLAVCLLLLACGDADDPALGDGSLGIVTVGRGDAVQIRSISAFDLSDAGALEYINAVEIAIEDYGPIHGEFTVELGEGINDPCSADDGPTTAPGKVSIIQHLNPSDPDASWDNVVYRFSP